MTRREPQFHTIYSNSYEALRSALGALCREERSRLEAESSGGPAAPWFFRKSSVIVPSRAVEADLLRYFARESASGVSAGIDFKLLGEWLTPVGGANLGVSSRGKELEWLLWAKLLDADFLERSESEALRHYLFSAAGGWKARSDASRYDLALKIAAAFTKYASYRLDWINNWIAPYTFRLGSLESERAKREGAAFEANASTLAWQKTLWLWLADWRGGPDTDTPRIWEGINDLLNLSKRMQRLDLDLDDDPFENRSPEAKADAEAGMALHVFAPSSLPPLALPFLYRQSLRAPVYLYVLNPSDEYWFEPGDWAIARRHFEGKEGASLSEGGTAASCPWLRRNAGQTRALVERVWRFTTAESAEEIEVEDDAEGRPGAVKPAREFRGFDPRSALQDLSIHVDDPDTVLSVDLAAAAGHGAGEEATRRTMLDAIHEAVARNNSEFLSDPDYAAEHPRERSLYRAGEPAGELPSVRIASGPTLRREVEGLVDWVYALRAKGLKADDILVVTPDLQKLAPVVDAVVSALPVERRIEYVIAGRAIETASSAMQGFLALGRFLYGRASVDDFEALIAEPAIGGAWGLSGDDAQRLCGWLRAASYRAGLSAAHLERARALGLVASDVWNEGGAAAGGAAEAGENEESGANDEPGEAAEGAESASDSRPLPDPVSEILQSAEAETTLERAIERLSAAAAIDCGENADIVWMDVRPVTGAPHGWRGVDVASNPELFEKLLAISGALKEAAGVLFATEGEAGDEEGAAAPDWEAALTRILELFFPRADTWWGAPDVEELRSTVHSLVSTVGRTFERAGIGDERIPFPVLWKALASRAKQQGRPAKADGRLLFTTMDAMRGIPFRAIAAVGLDSDSSFPGTTRLEEFDLMGKDGLKRRGDRDSRRDNRNIFADLVMAAREYLAVFYCAGASKEKALPPSEVVSDLEEFVEELEAGMELPPDRRGFWRLELPQTAFSRRNFSEEAREHAALGSSRAAFEALGARSKAAEEGEEREPELPAFAPSHPVGVPKLEWEKGLSGLFHRLKDAVFPPRRDPSPEFTLQNIFPEHSWAETQKAARREAEKIAAGVAVPAGVPGVRERPVALGGLNLAEGELPLMTLAAYLKDPEKFAMQLADIAKISLEAPDAGAERLARETGALEGYSMRKDVRESKDAGHDLDWFCDVRSFDPAYGAPAVRSWQVKEQAKNNFLALGLADEWKKGRVAEEVGPIAIEAVSFTGRRWRLTLPGLTLWRRGEGSSVSYEALAAPISEGELWEVLLRALFIDVAAQRPISLESFPIQRIAKDAKGAIEKTREYEEKMIHYEIAKKSAGPLGKAPKCPDRIKDSDSARPVRFYMPSISARFVLGGLLTLFEALVLEGLPLASEYTASPFHRGPEKKKLVDNLKLIKRHLHDMLRLRFADEFDRDEYDIRVDNDRLALGLAGEMQTLLRSLGSGLAVTDAELKQLSEDARRQSQAIPPSFVPTGDGWSGEKHYRPFTESPGKPLAPDLWRPGKEP